MILTSQKMISLTSVSDDYNPNAFHTFDTVSDMVDTALDCEGVDCSELLSSWTSALGALDDRESNCIDLADGVAIMARHLYRASLGL